MIDVVSNIDSRNENFQNDIQICINNMFSKNNFVNDDNFKQEMNFEIQ